MQKWFVAAKKADFNQIGQTFGITPVTARIIRNRDVIGDEAIREFLHGDLEDLHDPMLMKDLQKGAAIIEQKIKENQKIRIVGDYDIDGVCATYILLKGLRAVGANVDYKIPDRLKDGYGINENIIRKANEDGIDTIVTCDNGISAINEINTAKDLGMTVVVTDHHDIPYEDLEDGSRRYKESRADAIINPKQKECRYPFKELCGAVVAFKLVQVLYSHYFSGQNGYRKALDEFLPFAAIATVGDVMNLIGENRILVKYGLRAMALMDEEKAARTGIKAPCFNHGLAELIAENELDPSNISGYHIGFVIGPCINAGGRLDTAKRALELLLSDNKEEAKRLAKSLKQLNDERKDLTAAGTEEAIRLVEEKYAKDTVLVVYLPDCHESLAGIIAGRVRERFNKPSFVVTKSEDGLKGSGRSIEAYSMYEELVKVSSYLTKFGGHPMAAGLSLPEENLEGFREALNANSGLTEDDLVEKVSIDVPMPLEYVNERQIQELELLEPCGKGNEKPLFAQKDLNVLSARILGKNRNVVKFRLQSSLSPLSMDALYFGDVEEIDHYLREKFGNSEVEKMYLGRENRVTLSVVYYPGINEFRGNTTLQITIRNYM